MTIDKFSDRTFVSSQNSSPSLSFRRWYPIESPPTFLAGVFILQHHAGSISLICDGAFGDGRLLVLSFNGFESVVTHEEFSHRWLGEPSIPALPNSPGSSWTFPYLIIENSIWAANSVGADTFGEAPTHYCILSASDIVDVLSFEPPKITWVTIEEFDYIMAAIAKLDSP